jgi:hypothetical protein
LGLGYSVMVKKSDYHLYHVRNCKPVEIVTVL